MNKNRKFPTNKDLGAEGRNDTFNFNTPRLKNTLAGKVNTNFQIILKENYCGDSYQQLHNC